VTFSVTPGVHDLVSLFFCTRRGFDTHYGYYLGAEDYWNHTRSFMGFQGLDWRRGLLPVRNEGGLYSTHLLTAEVERIVSQHDPHTPLFLYLPYQGTVFVDNMKPCLSFLQPHSCPRSPASA